MQNTIQLTNIENAFRFATDLDQEDTRLGLKYVLLRLGDRIGLKEDDRNTLRDLVIAVCHDQDTSEAMARIRDSKVAFSMAIAGIIQTANEHRKAVCIGAILGAHALACAAPAEDARVPWSIFGAVSGAVAAAGIARLDDKSQGIGLEEFLARD